MMLTSRCTVSGSENRITAITLEWEFDKFFSADVNFNFDEDKNGQFDPAETERVFQYAFSNLKKYNYFVFFRVEDQRFSPEQVQDFQVWNKDDETMIYSFTIPLEDLRKKELAIAVYDYSFFCHVTYDEEKPVSFSLPPETEPYSYELKENRDYPVYYDPFAPATDLTLHREWRPGLKTYYPTEIQIAIP